MYSFYSSSLYTANNLFGASEAMFNSSSVLIILLILIVSAGAILLLSSVIRSSRKTLRAKADELLALKKEIARIKRDMENQRDKMAKELADTDKLHGILIEAADDGISFYDEDWNLVFANSAFYSVIGISRDDYNALHTESLIHPDDKDFSANRKKILADEGVYNAQIRIRHLNGGYVTLSTKTVQIKNDTGDVIGSLTISRDISEIGRAHV